MMKGRYTMNSTFIDTRTGIRYELQGDYYLPYLAPPEHDDRPIGIWGQRRGRYLKEHHKILYYNLLTSGKLHTHLADINEEAKEMYTRLVKELAEKEKVTEQLKANNQLIWVQRMNNIRNQVTEIVMNDYIHREEVSA